MVIQCDDKMMRIYICFTILLLEMSVIRNEDSAKKAEKEEDGKITSRSFTYRVWTNNNNEKTISSNGEKRYRYFGLYSQFRWARWRWYAVTYRFIALFDAYILLCTRNEFNLKWHSFCGDVTPKLRCAYDNWNGRRYFFYCHTNAGIQAVTFPFISYNHARHNIQNIKRISKISKEHWFTIVYAVC